MKRFGSRAKTRKRPKYWWEVRFLLDAASKRRSAPDPNGVHYRIFGESAGVPVCASLGVLHASERRHFRHREKKVTSCYSINQVGSSVDVPETLAASSCTAANTIDILSFIVNA